MCLFSCPSYLKSNKNQLMMGFKDALVTLDGYLCQLSVCLVLGLTCNRKVISVKTVSHF